MNAARPARDDDGEEFLVILPAYALSDADGHMILTESLGTRGFSAWVKCPSPNTINVEAAVLGLSKGSREDVAYCVQRLRSLPVSISTSQFLFAKPYYYNGRVIAGICRITADCPPLMDREEAIANLMEKSIVDGCHSMQAKGHTTTMRRRSHVKIVIAAIEHIRVRAAETLSRPPPPRVKADEVA